MEDKNILEDILKLSSNTDYKATTLVIEYIGYLHVGLNKKTALQYMNMKYNNKIKRYKNVSEI